MPRPRARTTGAGVRRGSGRRRGPGRGGGRGPGVVGGKSGGRADDGGGLRSGSRGGRPCRGRVRGRRAAGSGGVPAGPAGSRVVEGGAGGSAGDRRRDGRRLPGRGGEWAAGSSGESGREPEGRSGRAPEAKERARPGDEEALRRSGRGVAGGRPAAPSGPLPGPLSGGPGAERGFRRVRCGGGDRSPRSVPGRPGGGRALDLPAGAGVAAEAAMLAPALRQPGGSRRRLRRVPAGEVGARGTGVSGGPAPGDATEPRRGRFSPGPAFGARWTGPRRVRPGTEPAAAEGRRGRGTAGRNRISGRGASRGRLRAGRGRRPRPGRRGGRG